MSLTIFLQTKKAGEGKNSNGKSRKEKKSCGSGQDKSASQKKVYFENISFQLCMICDFSNQLFLLFFSFFIEEKEY